MNISSIDKTIREILKSHNYKIPRFQRPYSWEREHIEDFWNDSIIDSDSDYFIGSMVVYDLKDSADTFGVVDGQQRLTTITMLLSALRECFKIIDEDELAHGVQGLIEKKDLDNVMNYVVQTETSYPYFHEHIQKYDDPDTDSKNLKKEEENLEKGFGIIKEKLQDEITSIELSTTKSDDEKALLKLEKLKEIRDKILSLKVIYIDLDNEDDAYIIFETLNTRGKDLRVSDLVKNHLTKLLPKKNKSVDISKDKWTQSRDLVEGSNADLSMDSFLHHFWLSKHEYTTQKKLFKLIKKNIKKSNCKDFLNDIHNEVDIYRGILDEGYRIWSKQEVEIGKSLNALNLFRVKQQIPMVLSVMREYENKSIKLKHVKDILHAIECFHFIFTAITSQRSSGGISFMYAFHARELLNAKATNKVVKLNELKEKLRDKLPSRDEFIANFQEVEYTSQYTKERHLVKYILTKYDTFYSKKNKTGVVPNYDLMTIEHIYSEKDPSGTVAKEYIGKIGNLLLIDETLNIKLANKNFKTKHSEYLKSNIYLDSHIKNTKKWNNDEIEKRTEFIGGKLYDEVFKF